MEAIDICEKFSVFWESWGGSQGKISRKYQISEEKIEKIEKQKTSRYNIPRDGAVGENRIIKAIKPSEDYSIKKNISEQTIIGNHCKLIQNH